jgi:N-acetylglucosamine-6-phosphate deacetylase
MKHSTVLINGSIFEESDHIPCGFIRISYSKIEEIGDMSEYIPIADESVIDLQGKTVIPGMIDLHIHGTAGHDVMDGEIVALETMSKALPEEGTTSFLATTITQSDEEISKALRNVAKFLKRYQKSGQSEILGVHLEGPFINPKMAGAQPVNYILSPNISLFEKWQQLAEGNIRQVTIAPEQEGGIELVRHLRNSGVIVSIGHSNATYNVVKEAISAGATQVTHLFNQMRGLHHREPGVVGASLLLHELYAELIVDGIHVCPEMVNLAFNNKTSEKLILITDSIRAKCLKNGYYDLGGQTVIVKEGRAELANGTLAGSVLKLSHAMKNMLAYVKECSLQDIIKMTSYNPAKQLNMLDRKGSIRKGKDADLVILGKEHEVIMTFCRGKLAYQHEGLLANGNH